MPDESKLFEFEYGPGPQVAVPACAVEDLQNGEHVYGPETLEFTAGFTKIGKAPKDAVPGRTPKAAQARTNGVSSAGEGDG